MSTTPDAGGYEPNPFAAPRASLERPVESLDEPGAEQALEIRLAHRDAETSIKSISLLDFLSGGWALVLGLIYAGAVAVRLTSRPRPNAGTADTILLYGMAGGAAGCLLLSGLAIALGIGLRRLAVWARWIHVVLAGLALLGVIAAVAIGAEIVSGVLPFLINGYILYLLLSEKAKTIFSPGYQDVIRLTPQIQTRVSLVTKIVIGLLMLLLGAAVIGGAIVLLGGRR